MPSCEYHDVIDPLFVSKPRRTRTVDSRPEFDFQLSPSLCLVRRRVSKHANKFVVACPQGSGSERDSWFHQATWPWGLQYLAAPMKGPSQDQARTLDAGKRVLISGWSILLGRKKKSMQRTHLLMRHGGG